MYGTTVPPAATRSVLKISFRQVGVLAVVLAAVGLTAVAQGGGEPTFAPAETATYSELAAKIHDGLLGFEDRVEYQRRVEEVYWRHRIWPAENPGSKPALDEVLPDGVIRARVAKYLNKSAALEIFWSRPLTGEQLQAELSRMARDTKDPGLLRELFAALDDDPFLVAECLARPVLVDRLVRNWYARVDLSAGDRSERPFDTWWVEDGLAAVDAAGGTALVTPPSGGYELSSPPDRGCTAETWTELWYVPTARVAHTAVWTGAEMIVWGGLDGGKYVDTGGRYDPATDSWTRTATGPGVPTGRVAHTAVWTGTEMIVWGGHDEPLGSAVLNSGGRYNPATDTWTETTTGHGVPAERISHTAVWTGTEMIVWGGYYNGDPGPVRMNSGGRYHPLTDSWTATSTGG